MAGGRILDGLEHGVAALAGGSAPWGARSTWAPAIRDRDRDRALPHRVRCRAAAAMPPSVRTVSIPFADLKTDAVSVLSGLHERDRDLSGKIEEGLGPNGLGIISISDVSFLSVSNSFGKRLHAKYLI
ncbi:hypothetical protein ZWY2020_000732 [Hordeum vulgare]|nr:hypothetical protein ZWY2020_000732 [Hordeum vulgare]